MTWQLGPTTGVVEAIDSQGKPFHVGPPPMMATDLADQAPIKPHPDDCYVPVDRDLQRVIGWSLIGFWGVLLWWVLS